MKKNWFDICCWVAIIIATMYSTLYGTYRILEVLIK